jgi:hypothetical protein
VSDDSFRQGGEAVSDKCQRCGKQVPAELHSCPYSLEIEEDDTPCCNCCEDCEDECAMEV